MSGAKASETIELRAVATPVAIDVTLDAEERADAIAVWLGRMRNEHVSARVFAALVPQLMRAGIHDDRLVAATAMAREELEHARLCAGVVLGLGGDPVAELGVLDDVPPHLDAGPVEALVRNLISISCLSETVAVAQISGERELAVEPAVRDVFERILGDEVGHARFGWTLVEELVPTLDERARRRLDAYLVQAFRALGEFHRIKERGPWAQPSAPAQAVGVCDGNFARRLLLDAVGGVIVPGLEALGLHAEAACREGFAAA